MSISKDDLNDTIGICDDFLYDEETQDIDPNEVSPKKLQLKLCEEKFTEDSPMTVISKNLSGTSINEFPSDEPNDDNNSVDNEICGKSFIILFFF